MDSTAKLGLPYILAAQAQKHVTHNEALRALDVIVHLVVLDRDLTDPPGVPGESDAYLVASPAGGAWAGHEGDVAAYQDGAWMFYAPRAGWLAWVGDEAQVIVFDGSVWQDGIGGANASVDTLGVNTTADATNRLSVKSDAVLFSHDDVTPGSGSVQHKLNKNVATDTASMVFQTGFSGRAEFGLTGDDDFHVKVSNDGTSWSEALIVDRTTGAVAFPNTVGGLALPNLVINGQFQINQREFAGGSLAAGAFGFDRWKAGAAGANVTLSGYDVTLSSGKLVQTIEPEMWGVASLAGETVWVSVDAPTADLTVALGSVSGIIQAGAGRRSVALTLGAGDTGHLDLELSASGSVTFSRVAAYQSKFDVAYLPRSQAEDAFLCRYYFERIRASSGSLFVSVIGARSATVATGVISYSAKRDFPTINDSGSTDFDVLGIGGEVISTVTFNAAGLALSEITIQLGSGSMVSTGCYQLRMVPGGYIDVSAEI
jgi:Protein of unknown function (DUF2793)